jgi:hypothetical protein
MSEKLNRKRWEANENTPNSVGRIENV